jgi:hypothetical protein
MAIQALTGSKNGPTFPAKRFEYYCAAHVSQAPVLTLHACLRRTGPVTIPLSLRLLSNDDITQIYRGSFDGPGVGSLRVDLFDQNGKAIASRIKYVMSGSAHGQWRAGPKNDAARLAWGGRADTFNDFPVLRGTYSVTLADKILREFLSEKSVSVEANTTTALRLEIPTTLNGVLFCPPKQQVAGRVDLWRTTIDGTKPQHLCFWNQRPEERLIWLPCGEYRIRYTALTYVPSICEFSVTESGNNMVVAPRMQVR